MPRTRQSPGVASGAPSGQVAATTTHTVPRLRVRPGSATERFLRHHEQHPAVYRALVEASRRLMQARPGRRLSIAEVHEYVRWQLDVRTGETPQLTNTFRPFYARLIMAREPDLAGVFELRPSQADEMISDPPAADDGRLW